MTLPFLHVSPMIPRLLILFLTIASTHVRSSQDVSPSHLPLLNRVKDPASGSFIPIGGVAMDKPCCVSWGPGRVDCFIRAAESDVHHWYRDGATYQKEWISLGGIKVSGVECVSRAPGVLEILAVGHSLRLFVSAYTQATGKWEWTTLGNRMVDTPSCITRTPETIDCMVRNGANQAIYIDYNDGKWSGWGRRGGMLSFPSKTSKRSSTITDYWHVGSRSNLWQTYRAKGRWGGWSNLGGRLRGQPEVVAMSEKRIDVIVMGTKNQLMHLVWNGQWQQWVDLGGTIVDTPSCVAVGTSIHCFYVSADSYLYRRTYEGEKWSTPFCAYGAFLEGPKCVISGEKEVSCYLRAFDRALVEMVYKF